MYRILIFYLIFATQAAAQFLWSQQQLQFVKHDLLTNSHSIYKSAYNDLIQQAKKFSTESPVSVMNKRHIPANGDKHNYQSLSRYYWPNPKTPDGLPYIHKDGQSNPELKEYDRQQLEIMSKRIQIFTLAWYLSDSLEYAKKAMEQIDIWFLDSATKMNPNMDYAQIIPGRDNNKGHSFGVLDGYSFVQMLDALTLLEQTEYFTPNKKKQIHQWFYAFAKWLKESSLGNREKQAFNNHGTTYDTQLLAYSLYIGDLQTAGELIDHFAKRHLLQQIELDGSQPQELKRTLSFHYSRYNLAHMLDFYLIANNRGFSISNATSINGHDFYRALDFLTNYIGKKVEDWPYRQISDWEKNQIELLKDIYKVATILNPEKNEYIKLFNEYAFLIHDYLFCLLYQKTN